MKRLLVLSILLLSLFVGNTPFSADIQKGLDAAKKETLRRTSSEKDELIVHTCNLDDTTFGKKTIFDFSRHRRIEHYKPITSQIGVILPKE